MSSTGLVTRKVDVKYIVCSVIGLFFLFGFGYIPAIAPLTQVGMQILGIFIGLIFMWSAVELIWPSILGIVAFGMSDYCTLPEAIASGLGNQVIWMLIMLLILAEAIRVSGVGEIIARFLVTRKFLGGRPLLFTFVYLWGFFISTMLLGSTAAIFLSWAIFYSIAKLAGYRKGDSYCTAMIIGCMLITVVGGGMLPFQGWMPALCASYSEATGVPINYAHFMIIGFCIGTLLSLLVALSIKFVFRCNLEPLKDFDVSAIAAEGVGRMNRRQKCYLGGFLVIVLYVLVTTLLPAGWPLVSWLNSITQPGFFGVIVAVLAMVRDKDGPILPFKELASTGIHWAIVFVCSAAIPIASALTSSETGVLDLFSSLLSPVFSDMPLLPFLSIVVAAVVILTNIGSNIGVAMMIIPIIMPFVLKMDINPSIFGIAVIFLSNLGFVLPGSSANAPFLYSNDWVEVKDIYRYGIYYCLVTIIVAIPVLYAASFIL